jgi:hypothetical protein
MTWSVTDPCLCLLDTDFYFSTGLRSLRLIGCISFVFALFSIAEIYAIP